MDGVRTMTPDTIACPRCGGRIPVSKLLTEQIREIGQTEQPGKTRIGTRHKHGATPQILPTKKNQDAVRLGRLGGQVRSPAKARAARENGKKGGRPPNKDRRRS